MKVKIISQSNFSEMAKEICKNNNTMTTAVSLIGNNELGFYGEISHPEKPESNKFKIIKKDNGYYMKGTMILEGHIEKEFFIEELNGPNDRNICKMMKHPEFMEYVIANYDPNFSGVVEYQPYLLYNPGSSLVYPLMVHVFCETLDIESITELYDALKVSVKASKYLKNGDKKSCQNPDLKSLMN